MENTKKAEGQFLIKSLLHEIGENPNREGLLQTPHRVVKSWEEIYSGYSVNPENILTIFNEPCNEIVILKNIELYSMCEHHMLPFYGKAHVAYLPDNNKVVGISKLARLVDIYSKRLQIQERLCQQVTKALMDILKPKGAACVIEATHLCMRMRGVANKIQKW